MDERTQFEMYYPPFQAAINAGVGSLMCSYNLINGVKACANDEVLNKELRDTLGYKGFVMSDWNAAAGVTLAEGLD